MNDTLLPHNLRQIVERHGTVTAQSLPIRDVRADMPNYFTYKDHQNLEQVLGLAIHHSAMADPATGLSLDNSARIFASHVNARQWQHGGYHYLIRPNGVVEYALDEKITGFHAGFRDPSNHSNLEYGQYWNNHYLAICLLGWYEENRVIHDGAGAEVRLPNYFTHPPARQWQSLVLLAQMLCQKYAIPLQNVRGHRELEGCQTRCPGANVSLSKLREQIANGEFVTQTSHERDV